MQTSLLTLSGAGLEVAGWRARAIAQNLANIDTPGYKAETVPFAANLRRAMAGQGPRVASLTGTVERNDGNNVSVDQQMTLLAKNTLLQQTMSGELRNAFARLGLVINGTGVIT
ncbi:MAG: hypothetical protein M0Z27_11855 [Thermaerobacter sp.]|nr:hypothetical protein [Thermaerobacter sp.]